MRRKLKIGNRQKVRLSDAEIRIKIDALIAIDPLARQTQKADPLVPLIEFDVAGSRVVVLEPAVGRLALDGA